MIDKLITHVTVSSSKMQDAWGCFVLVYLNSYNWT